MTRLVKDSNGSAISFGLVLARCLAAAEAGEGLDAGELTWVCDDAGDRRRGGGQGRCQVRPAALALAAFEVPVRRAHRDLAGRQLVAVHRDAHRAAGLAPVGASGAEDLVEALRLGLALDLIRSRDDEHPDALVDAPPTHRRGREAKVADPAVRARADEHDVDGLAEDRL